MSTGERLSVAWTNIVNVLLGRKAVKTVDACAMYWGRVVKVNGGLVDVQLDSPDIASPTGIPIYLSIPGALTLAGGERVLVGFRNGDPSQPYVFGVEQGTSATEAVVAASSLYLGQKAGAKLVIVADDHVDCGTLTVTAVANGVFVGTYVDPFGVVTVITLGTPIPIKGKTIASVTRTRAA